MTKAVNSHSCALAFGDSRVLRWSCLQAAPAEPRLRRQFGSVSVRHWLNSRRLQGKVWACFEPHEGPQCAPGASSFEGLKKQLSGFNCRHVLGRACDATVIGSGHGVGGNIRQGTRHTRSRVRQTVCRRSSSPCFSYRQLPRSQANVARR